jgi:hypothetical protein
MRLRDFGANSYSASCYVNTVLNEKQSIERNDCKDGRVRSVRASDQPLDRTGWYQQSVHVEASRKLAGTASLGRLTQSD